MDIPDGIPNAFQIIQYPQPARPANLQRGNQPATSGFIAHHLQPAPDALSLRGEIDLLRVLIQRVVEAGERDGEPTLEQAGKTLNLCSRAMAQLARLIQVETTLTGSSDSAAEALHQALLDLAGNLELG